MKSMTFIEQLLDAQQRNQSMLCVGLDPDPAKLPAPWRGDASRIYDFCAAIVDATADLVIAFKPQIAYFAACGADAVTLSPFMGFDTVQPYLRYPDKGAFLLCRTSNPGGSDIQNQRLADVPGQPKVFEHIAAQSQGAWNENGQLGLVVGATYPDEIKRVRELAPTLPLLIPGVGAQGGDAVATVRAGWRADAPIVVNSSRAVIYASAEADFAAAARTVAQATREQLEAAKP